ncbi:uncharacterized protein LOC121250977 [Juglans microcarpa x Juglans regia]|uniref:uncharacterized protein LOC121250977 n=1 Tax=Juglans microcarpa x Juglans regia TaxID=2249226 RepID=UPI001B7E9F7C|nr:uncharacterized protein LOC121250977 [Juglans microcarpa x Juglans regia]
MEAEAQKMLALKKAYAEIILNTAKEAAARVMTSERKALRFQQDLRATKDEAIRMLVRLKQMIDSKATETEMASLGQQKRIEELEAQLNEAEDVIGDLRTELKQVWGALEKVKSNQARSLNGQIKKEDASSDENAAADPIRPSLSNSGFETMMTSDMKNAPLNERVSVDNSCITTKESDQPSVSLMNNYYANDSDLASIMKRSKESELYKNGFTQRIRAFERNFVDGKVPSSGDVDDQHSLKKNELITEVSNKDEGKCLQPSSRTSNSEMMNSSIGKEVKNPIKTRTLQRRNIRFGKAKATSWKSCPRPDQLMKLCQPSSVLSCCKTLSVNGNVKSAESTCTIPNFKADKEKVHEGNGEKGMENGDANASVRSRSDELLSKPCQPYSVISCQRTSLHSINGNVKSGEERSRISETDSGMKPSICLDPGLTLITHDVDPRSGSADLIVDIKDTNESGFVQNAARKDMELVDKFALVKHKVNATKNLVNPSSELDHGMFNKPLMNSYLKDAEASEATNVSARQGDSNRLLMYTFRRKRKKESLSFPDGNASLENRTTKRRSGDKQSDAPKPQNSSIINDSSRDSRRLAQIARQLISLSGKRWW